MSANTTRAAKGTDVGAMAGGCNVDEGKSDQMSVSDAVAMIHSTSPSDRSRFAREILRLEAGAWDEGRERLLVPTILRFDQEGATGKGYPLQRNTKRGIGTMFRAFIRYKTHPDEMVVVWRLQTLASASGLHLDVLSPSQHGNWHLVSATIDRVDVVLAFVTNRITSAVKQEINYAAERNKQRDSHRQGRNTHTLFDARHEGVSLQTERTLAYGQDVAELLRNENLKKSTRDVVLALIGTAAGLLLLWGLTGEKH